MRKCQGSYDRSRSQAQLRFLVSVSPMDTRFRGSLILLHGVGCFGPIWSSQFFGADKTEMRAFLKLHRTFVIASATAQRVSKSRLGPFHTRQTGYPALPRGCSRAYNKPRLVERRFGRRSPLCTPGSPAGAETLACFTYNPRSKAITRGTFQPQLRSTMHDRWVNFKRHVFLSC